MTGKTTGSAGKRERKSVIALIRVSTDDQAADDKGGIPAQEHACETIAGRYGLEIKWRIQIEGISGAGVRRSPQFQELIRIVKSGQCDGIVIKEESRLMRRADSAVLQMLETYRVKLYCLDTVLDFSNSSQKLLGTMKFAFGDYERDLIRDRTVSGKAGKRRRGEWVGGANSVPFGLELYKAGKLNRLRVNPLTIGRVTRLFELFIEYGGFSSFAQLARESGVPFHSIEYVLQNEIYTGYYVSRLRVNPDRNVYWGPEAGIERAGKLRYQRREPIPIDERERIKMFDDAPISDVVFAQAQKLLALRKEMRVRVREGVEDLFLYRGFLRCAGCGRRLITVSYTNKKANNFHADYYVCQGAHGSRNANGTWYVKNGTCSTRRIRRETLEPMLDRLISDRLSNPKLLSEIIDAQAAAEAESSSEQKLERLNLEIAETLRAIERNHELYVRGKIQEGAFARLDGQLQMELRAARAELQKTKPDLGRITPEMWAPIARQFLRWNKLDNQKKRAMLAAIAPTFEVVGVAGKGYHETVIAVKALRLDLGHHKPEDGGDDGEEVASPELVPSQSLLCSARDVNQSSIYLNL
jgi:DNA invertase Pin-like site-specific DNA recombinase